MPKHKFSHELATRMLKDGTLTQRAFDDMKASGVIGPSAEELRIQLFEEPFRQEVASLLEQVARLNLQSKNAQIRLQVVDLVRPIRTNDRAVVQRESKE